MNKYKEIAIAKFNEGFNCSQSVLFPFANMFNLNEETALKISCGFGAGMGRQQETCGAVTAAYMLIGLKYGKSRSDEEELKEKTYLKVCEFTKKFCQKHKTIKCSELLVGCDFVSLEGKKRFKNESLKEKVCVLCVGDSVDILKEILN